MVVLSRKAELAKMKSLASEVLMALGHSVRTVHVIIMNFRGTSIYRWIINLYFSPHALCLNLCAI